MDNLKTEISGTLKAFKENKMFNNIEQGVNYLVTDNKEANSVVRTLSSLGAKDKLASLVLIDYLNNIDRKVQPKKVHLKELIIGKESEFEEVFKFLFGENKYNFKLIGDFRKKLVKLQDSELTEVLDVLKAEHIQFNGSNNYRVSTKNILHFNYVGNNIFRVDFGGNFLTMSTEIRNDISPILRKFSSSRTVFNRRFRENFNNNIERVTLTLI